MAILEMCDVDELSKNDKEALCYRLLVERDKLNERLRTVQESLRKDTDEAET
jgi:hypothetical protein